MEQSIEVVVTKEHFEKSPGYIFDDCPLKLALKEIFPNSFISIGAIQVVIIHDTKNDKEALIYYLPSFYNAKEVDFMIGLAKKGNGGTMTVVLDFAKKQDNYFYHEPNNDHVEKQFPQITKDPFIE